ncbi:ABC transporter ATP-binding protein/permease [Actinoplanes bogorensis]|uniref:ABC transporter ATP-binding protein/permease n=1 Tax=Paractinoplanes bogorensis TaxID=1610840 RepID=A0ABS5Z5F6_9ACTN|nr:ABC transporter ATP-binding protein [Actinoplanes bogorensis]MBU2670873.1 ABC transporter ATP-binding protein/permease [Actinoplanes bogorensis]
MIRQLARVLGAPYAGPLRRHLAGVLAYAVLQGLVFVLLVPVLRPLLRGDTDGAQPWLGVLAVVVLATAVAYWVQAQLGYRLGMALSRALHHRIGDHLAALPLGWFTPARVGRVARMSSTGVVDVMGVPAHLLQPVVTAYVSPAVVVLAMLFVDWRLAVAALITVPLIVLVFRWSARLLAATDVVVDTAGVEASNRIVEFAQQQAVLRAYGRTGEGFAQLDAALTEVDRANRRQLLKGGPGLVASALMVQLSVTVVIVAGVAVAVGTTVDAASLVALLVLTVRFAEPLVAAADLGAALRMARNSLDRMDELLRTPVLPEPSAASSFSSDGSIELDGVTFGYDDRRVLDGLSLTVPAHSMTALVGPSGSGKTTVVRLVARFFDTLEGTVRVGGRDVRDLTTEQLMAQISVVFQDVYLFDASITDNIRAGRAEATDDEVLEAARLARVDEIATRLPDGYDTMVGEGGARLSGGERQRISIARAILKNAPIVLLDEATAALDPDNEAAIGSALAALTADRTLLVIAHRLQTVRSADQIVVLDNGRIAETGTHDQLLAAGGRYAAFWSERTRASGWRLVSGAV